MDLVRDVLDKQVIDRHSRKLGKVDGIVLELRPDGPPRVAFVEIGLAVLLCRFSPSLGGVVELLERRLGIRGGDPVRIAASKIREAGIDVHVDVDASETEALAWEQWLGKHVVRHLPGGRA
jgi:hypothetical protein